MTSRDLVIQALCHRPVDRVARDLWSSPRIETASKDELEEMCYRYPCDFQEPEHQPPRGKRSKGAPGRPGRHTDAWGCTWRIAEPGADGEPGEPPLADLAAVAAYRPPVELFDSLSPKAVNRSCAATSRFVLARSDVRPLQRLELLHGKEVTRVDLACGNRAVRELLDAIHECHLREIAWWAATEVDGVVIRDSLGDDSHPELSAEIWRDLFKPLLGEYCRLLREQDKFVFFCAAGDASGFLDELIELGVDAIDWPLPKEDLDALAGRLRGRIAVWGGLNGQCVASGSIHDCRNAVRRLRKALDYGQGGLIAKCVWDVDTRFENVAAVFEEWCQPMPTCF